MKCIASIWASGATGTVLLMPRNRRGEGRLFLHLECNSRHWRLNPRLLSMTLWLFACILIAGGLKRPSVGTARDRYGRLSEQPRAAGVKNI